MKKLLLVASHLLTGALGFALGVYTLPILIAPPAPTGAEVATQAASARYTGKFRRDLKDSDALHWGEGTVSIGARSIVLDGELAPGPDYKLYLSPEFVETEADFQRLKPRMVRVGDVKTFKNFAVRSFRRGCLGAMRVDQSRRRRGNHTHSNHFRITGLGRSR